MKVHFAGLEQMDSACVLNKVCGVQYGLFSVFPFIANQFDIKAVKFKMTIPKVANYLDKHYKHVIMDSGLFTLMFGAHAGPRDAKFVEAWQKAIIRFVLETGYKGTVVEVDCQKILGVDHAWKLRKELREALPNQQINVWHIDDGIDGLKEMAAWSEYIALSIPEFRSLYWDNLPMRTLGLCKIIKEVNPNIKIHLLGCTQKDIMRVTKFCDSSDSTSWNAVNRYGIGTVLGSEGFKKVRVSDMKDQADLLVPQIERIFIEDKIDPTGKDANNMTYYGNYAIAGISLKEQYSRYAGDQN